MADNEQGDGLPQAQVSASAAKAVGITAVTQLVMLITFSTAVLAFVSKHDLAGLINYLQGDAALPALSLIAALGASGFSLVRSYLRKRREVRFADAAPEAVAVVVNKS